MSGRGSRARRVEATSRARKDVYARRGGPMPAPPFDNERQNRIYAKAYEAMQKIYTWMETL